MSYFLQVDIFNTKKAKIFSENFPSRPVRERDGTSSGRDGTRDGNPVPTLFRDGTRDGVVSILFRPVNTPSHALYGVTRDMCRGFSLRHINVQYEDMSQFAQ